jgi:cytochrome b involved in lipid metabolism
MNKYILWGVVAVLAIAGVGYVVISSSVPQTQKQPPATLGDSTNPTSTGSTTSTTGTITAAQLATHSNQNDCWTSINGRVYDVTSVISTHPAGPEVILATCGKDGTAAFMTRAGRGPHPTQAQQTIDKLFRGTLAN